VLWHHPGTIILRGDDRGLDIGHQVHRLLILQYTTLCTSWLLCSSKFLDSVTINKNCTVAVTIEVDRLSSVSEIVVWLRETRLASHRPTKMTKTTQWRSRLSR
jgi:hypothetical protein